MRGSPDETSAKEREIHYLGEKAAAVGRFVIPLNPLIPPRAMRLLMGHPVGRGEGKPDDEQDSVIVCPSLVAKDSYQRPMSFNRFITWPQR